MKPGRIDRRLGQHFVDYQSCTLSPGKKKRRRIRNLGWVTELYGVPNDELMENGRQDCPRPGQEPRENESIDVEVRKAVARLRPEEKQFVDLFYFQFRSYKEIARRTGKKVRKLETINNRVREKLKLLLADFVKKRFGVIVPPISDCVICSSPNRAAIDELIRKKRDHQTCSGLISILRREYDLDIRTPQVIIGHRRKHMV
jgi:RNA polymerase sigma factor (sigma-70 family)